MYTDNPKLEIRTIFNACSQFWSIISLLVVNKLHQLIDEAELQDSVKVISSIYDSIYLIVKEDVKTIKWVNDTLIPLMVKDFMHNQIVPNKAKCEIGYNWADLHVIENNVSAISIGKLLNKLKKEKRCLKKLK